MLVWGSQEDRVIGVSLLSGLERDGGLRRVRAYLNMLLQILRALKGLATEVAFVRLEGNMDSNVGGDMITLHGGSSARVPATGEIKIVCALATDMFLTNVFLYKNEYGAQKSTRGW